MVDPSQWAIGQWLYVAGGWVSLTGDVMVLFSLVAALTFARHDLARRWRVAAIATISSMVFLQVASGVLATIGAVFVKMAVQEPVEVEFLLSVFTMKSSLVILPTYPDPHGIVPIYVYLPVALLAVLAAWSAGREFRRRRAPTSEPPTLNAPVDA